MIDNQTYAELLDNGLVMDHYFLLCQIRDGEKPPPHRRVQGFLNLLNKKGFLKEDELTEKGLSLVQGPPVVAEETKVKDKEGFRQWVNELHSRCQEKLMKHTGARQIKDRVNGKAYSFLPNSVDLHNALQRVVKLYKVDDCTKVELCIMQYIEHCAKARSWFPVLQYYIIKNNTSQLVTDMESLGQVESSQVKGDDNYNSTQQFV